MAAKSKSYVKHTPDWIDEASVDGGAAFERRSSDIMFVQKTKAPSSHKDRRKNVVYVHLDFPKLDSFVHNDLKPLNILLGAGLTVTKPIPPEAVIEAGLPATVVRDFAAASGMTLSDVGSIVGTSERTMSRKIAQGRNLEPATSDRAYRLFTAVARAVRAFGDVDKARRWLQRDVLSLGRRKPVDLLRTEIGTREVMSALDRIEFGGVA